jgi:hypothetical protein
VGEKIAELKKLIFSNEYFDYKNNEIKINQVNEDKVRNKIFSNLDLAFELLDLSCELQGKQKYFAYSYLQFFICIEEFLGIKKLFEFGDMCYVNNNILIAKKDPSTALWTSSIKFIQEKPNYYIMKVDSNNPKSNPSQTDFKMSSVLIYLFNQDNSKSENWPKIRDIRNQKAAHPEKGNVTSEDITQLLCFLEFIFNKDNLNFETIKKGLPNEIKEVDLEILKNKFQNR